MKQAHGESDPEQRIHLGPQDDNDALHGTTLDGEDAAVLANALLVIADLPGSRCDEAPWLARQALREAFLYWMIDEPWPPFETLLAMVTRRRSTL